MSCQRTTAFSFLIAPLPCIAQLVLHAISADSLLHHRQGHGKNALGLSWIHRHPVPKCSPTRGKIYNIALVCFVTHTCNSHLPCGTITDCTRFHADRAEQSGHHNVPGTVPGDGRLRCCDGYTDWQSFTGSSACHTGLVGDGDHSIRVLRPQPDRRRPAAAHLSALHHLHSAVPDRRDR